MNSEVSRQDYINGQEQRELQRRDYLRTQLAFAEKMHEITGAPLKDCWLDYTNLYSALRFPKPRDPENKDWLSFVKDLSVAEDKAKFASDYFINIVEGTGEGEREQSCFSYEYDDNNGMVRIHFTNHEPGGISPLSEERVPARRSELTKIFTEIKKLHPDAKTVKGSSWLYNLASYRRIFPPEYIANMERSPRGFTGTGVWGQFITKDGGAKTEQMHDFLTKLEKAKTKEEAINAFPLMRQDVGCDIKYFYEFLGIKL